MNYIRQYLVIFLNLTNMPNFHLSKLYGNSIPKKNPNFLYFFEN